MKPCAILYLVAMIAEDQCDHDDPSLVASEYNPGYTQVVLSMHQGCINVEQRLYKDVLAVTGQGKFQKCFI